MNTQGLRKGNPVHGMHGTPLYAVWKGMMCRCYTASSTSYPRYGGAGITVCHRWHLFEQFYEDMHEGYKPGLSIERCNGKLGYEPGNCTWKTRKEQGRNKGNNIVGRVGAWIGPLSAAVEQFGSVNYQAAWARIRLGWPFYAAVTYPPRARRPAVKRVLRSAGREMP